MDTFERISGLLLEMGEFACDAQADILRGYKDDGTVLTQTDLIISEKVIALIRDLFPKANIVTEETLTPFCKDAELTFILDPIDGTDVYSQGLPSWCIALGILDANHKCIGGMVNAPRWGLSRNEGLFLRQDPGKPMLLNGKAFSVASKKDDFEQIAMASHAHRYLDLSQFKGKMRCYGSNILHMVSPLIHSHIQGSVSVPCYAWDVAAAHALLLSQDMVVTYADGSPFEYDDRILVERQAFRGILVAGPPIVAGRLSRLVKFL